MYKLLAHAASIISDYNDGYGLEQLSEEGLESSNKLLRRFRERLSRKFSFEENLKDVFSRIICQSDPILLLNKKMRKSTSRSSKILPEANLTYPRPAKKASSEVCEKLQKEYLDELDRIDKFSSFTNEAAARYTSFSLRSKCRELTMFKLDELGRKVVQFISFKEIESLFVFLHLVEAEKDGYAIPKPYFSLQKNNFLHRWSQVDEILSTVENYQASNSDHLAKVINCSPLQILPPIANDNLPCYVKPIKAGEYPFDYDKIEKRESSRKASRFRYLEGELSKAVKDQDLFLIQKMNLTVNSKRPRETTKFSAFELMYRSRKPRLPILAENLAAMYPNAGEFILGRSAINEDLVELTNVTREAQMKNQDIVSKALKHSRRQMKELYDKRLTLKALKLKIFEE
ncbi:hypothetical protein LOD99_1457 [Oopsacas minuta]|uniref:Uncharacterized protein n=1 Tax=Oopsacas minuta TaxID=111878 RepID=A0AAV7K5T5_9METZ|nr:hypothetical protein LOD99_1457 [Oopsacas minuta]